MPFLAILIGIVALMAAVPFLGGQSPSQALPYDRQSDIDAGQIQTFARAAWWAARGGTTGPVVTGSIPRSSMALPPGFTDNLAYPYQAWSDGTYVWVWSADPAPEAHRVGPTFQGWDASGAVAVGLSDSSLITWRYKGTTSPRPAIVSFPSLVIRISLS